MMYGPLFTAARGAPEAEEEVMLEGSELSTYGSGDRSGLPLWGNYRRIGSPLGRLKGSLGSDTALCDMSNDDFTITRRTTSRSRPPMYGENQSFGYYELMWELRRESAAATAGTADDEMFTTFTDDCTDDLIMELRRRVEGDPENVRLLCNYARMEPDLRVGAEALHRAFARAPDDTVLLNAFGALFAKVGERARARAGEDKPDAGALADRDALFSCAVRWEGRRAVEPSVYSQMGRHLKRLDLQGSSGYVQLGRFLHGLQRVVEAEEMRRKAQASMEAALHKAHREGGGAAEGPAAEGAEGAAPGEVPWEVRAVA